MQEGTNKTRNSSVSSGLLLTESLKAARSKIWSTMRNPVFQAVGTKPKKINSCMEVKGVNVPGVWWLWGGGFAAKMNKTQINPKFNLFCGSLPCEKSFLFFSVLFQERKHCKVAPRYCHQMAPKHLPCAALRDPQKSSEKAECDSL